MVLKSLLNSSALLKKKKVKIKSTSTLNSCKEVHRVIKKDQALHYTLFFLPISSLLVLGKLYLQCGLRTLNRVLKSQSIILFFIFLQDHSVFHLLLTERDN